MKLSNTSFFLGNQIVGCKEMVVEFLSVMANIFTALLPTTIEYKHYSEEQVRLLYSKLGEIKSDFSFMEESEVAVKLTHLKEVYESCFKEYSSKENQREKNGSQGLQESEKTLERSGVEDLNPT